MSTQVYDPRTDPHTRYVFKASLAQLIGWSYAISVIEVPSAHTHQELLDALAEIEAKLTPYPHLFPGIHSWFWETPAGELIITAQWVAYKDEAVWPMHAIRMLWGVPNLNRLRWLDRLIMKHKIVAYVAPQHARERYADVERVKYLRRSHLLALIESGEHLKKIRLKRKMAV